MKLYEFQVVQYLDGGGQGDTYLVLHLPSNKNYVMKLMWNKSGQTEGQVLAAADREICANQLLAGCCGNIVTYHSFNW